ncbi:hypothetical protein ACKWTF_006197 [Chironomus riparius]
MSESKVEQLNIDVSTDAESRKEGSTHRKHKFGSGILRYCCNKVFKYCKEKEMTQNNDESSTFEEYCELEELEAPQRYRPDSLAQICKTTRFSEPEIKRMYRGFKSHCPNGMVKEDTFKIIYAQFFPQGANTGLYAHYIFNTLDKDHTGTLSFEKFVQGLSILSRGSLEEKLCWTFQLYDINSDGHITREEMSDIVTAVYSLMGHPPEDKVNEETIKERVESMFNKMDRNHDGVVTIDEFLDCCRCDKAIMNSMLVFDSTI